MKRIIKIDNKIVTIYYDENIKNTTMPVVIFNSYDEDGQAIWDLSKKEIGKKYILVTISNIKWNEELSPWFANKVFDTEDDFSGKADEYIDELVYKIIPQIISFIMFNLNIEPEYFVLGGYSLAGLFAIYSLYKTMAFKRVFSASGSMWYPNFLEFVREKEIRNKVQKAYFSLGNKEAKTRNETMSKVEENTKEIVDIFKEKNIDVVYEENEGNHFQDITERIVKAIKWTIK